MKQWFIIVIVGIIILSGIVGYEKNISRQTSCSESEADLQEHISSEIIRFHVLANSDADADQTVKLKVKDTVVKSLQVKLKDARNIKEARIIINDNIPLIETTADKVLSASGFSYTAKVTLGSCDFPVKQYGDLTFPSGNYEALRIQLGDAEGKNWWCVMFPSLCYVDETYQVITEENKEKFQKILTPQEYDSLLTGQEGQVFHKSKLLPYLQRIFCKIKSSSHD